MNENEDIDLGKEIKLNITKYENKLNKS